MHLACELRSSLGRGTSDIGKDEGFATKKELYCKKVFVTCSHWLLSQAGALTEGVGGVVPGMAGRDMGYSSLGIAESAEQLRAGKGTCCFMEQCLLQAGLAG